MINSYPANFVMPDTGTYSGTVDVGAIRTPFPASLSSQNTVYNSPATEISLTFSMKNEDYPAWLAWVQSTAYNWFDMPVVAPSETPTDITSVQRCRFTSELSYQKRGDGWLSVTVAAEVIPYAA